MKKMIKYGAPVILGLALGLTAYAQMNINTLNNSGLPETSNVNVIITSGVQWFLALVGIIALVIIVWAGVTYMTAGGDEERVARAKARLTYGLIGVVVAIAGLAIMYFIEGILSEPGNQFDPANLYL